MTAFFEGIYNGIANLWEQIVFAVSSSFNDGHLFFDILDIIVVAFLLYNALVFLRETRAGQLVKGIAVMLILYALANLWSLSVLQWILSVVFNSAIIVFAIVFQPELRRILERVGQTKLRGGKFYNNESSSMLECIETVGKAARIMQESKTGALIVFEQSTQLGEIINTGTVINADASVSLITNIFFPKAPLHDGAVIIRDGRIYAAGCILPLTQNNGLSQSLGTRHRAAIGMTENSDAVVLVVSEETGNISLVKDGEITRGYNGVSATEALLEMLGEKENAKDSGFMGRVKALNPFAKSKESEEEKNEKTSE